jgi:hypothetical protein
MAKTDFAEQNLGRIQLLKTALTKLLIHLKTASDIGNIRYRGTPHSQVTRATRWL